MYERVEDEIARGPFGTFRRDVRFERGEIRVPVLSDDNHFPVDDGRLDIDLLRSRHQCRKARGPIVAAARIAVHLAVVDPQLEAVPVQLYFVHPLLIARRQWSSFRQAWLDEGWERGALRFLALAADPQRRIVETPGVLTL